jgi:hypothetical protein
MAQFSQAIAIAPILLANRGEPSRIHEGAMSSFHAIAIFAMVEGSGINQIPAFQTEELP